MQDTLKQLLLDAASVTPDPERASKNLLTFCENNPGHLDALSSRARLAALLFSTSQFLATFASSEPEALFEAIDMVNLPPDEEAVSASLDSELEGLERPSQEVLMDRIRIFKKKLLLRLMLRDILGKADIVESMEELSLVASVVIGKALEIVTSEVKDTYGEPDQNAFAVIAVGKLGSWELNFSSDVDLLYVYRSEEGETSGIMTSSGKVKNRISSHEYYCKLGESLNRFLSQSTENGIGYRVDLRLRPEGQRGSLALSLFAYEVYYESWGRGWERAMLLRARPIAGDAALGREFIEMINPFVYRKYLDFNAIEEIRQMKTKIDERFKKDDIKRGYGGIREIEFFCHALQLIYGGKEPILRERSTLRGLHHLLQKNLIGQGDYAALSDNYTFLRRLEHRLQQLNDLQTHTLPSSEQELTALAKKMGYLDRGSFLEDLKDRRWLVRRVYDSLFTAGKPAAAGDQAASVFLSEELTYNELKDLLSGYPVRDAGKVARNILHIREGTLSYQTIRGQRLLRRVLPAFLHEALISRDPDTAVHHLEAFISVLTAEESYLDLFTQNDRLVPILIRVFTESDYLTKTIMKRRDYLELLGSEMFLRKTLSASHEELDGMIASGQSLVESIRIFKQMEEIRLGILYLDKKIDIIRLMKGLTKAADAILSSCLKELRAGDLTVIGLGKLGGRELTFGSDLDVIFVCGTDVTEEQVKAAERLIRLLLSYTQDGMAYNVDTRLRPEGSRGPLVSTVKAFEEYYLKAAHFWEFQALLKARAAAGDRTTACSFIEMKKAVLSEKGEGVTVSDIRTMRERIEKELSKEALGYDIKLGTGGLEELEFTVQYLQLKNGRSYPEIFVPSTLDAIRRLHGARAIDGETSVFLRETYIFYRTLESLLRLIGEQVLKEDSRAFRFAAEFRGFSSRDLLLQELKDRRKKVREIFEGLR